MESHLRVEIVPRPAPAETTVPCDGSCVSTDPHDAHLTPEGKAYFEKQQWSARFNGTEVPLVDFAVQYDPESGRPLLSLVLAPDAIAVGDPTTSAVEASSAPLKVSSWGDGSVPDPREGIPGWEPQQPAATTVPTLEGRTFARLA